MNILKNTTKYTNFKTKRIDSFSELLIRQNILQDLSKTVNLELTFSKRIDSQEIKALDNNSGNSVLIKNYFDIPITEYITKIVNSAVTGEYKEIICIISQPAENFTHIINWFNSLSSSKTKFYVVKMELYNNDNSLPTTNFSLVTHPNLTLPAYSLAKVVESHRTLKTFWNFFNQYLTYNNPLNTLLYKRVSNISSYDFNIKYCSSYISLSISKDLKKISVSLYLGIDNEIFQRIEIDKELLFDDQSVNLKCLKSSEHCVVSVDMDVINLTNLQYLNTYFNWFYSNINTMLDITLKNKTT